MSFGILGGAIAGVVGTLAAFTAAAWKGYQQTQELDAMIITTGGSLGATRGEIELFSGAVDNATNRNGPLSVGAEWSFELLAKYDRAIAEIAVDVNATVENIGARRLQTVLERILDDISFSAPDRSGETVTVDAAAVQAAVGDLARNKDLSRFIL